MKVFDNTTPTGEDFFLDNEAIERGIREINARGLDYFYALSPGKERGKYKCITPECEGSSHTHGGSLSIYKEKSTPGHTYYHCFSCGFTGDVVEMICLKEGLSTLEVVKKYSGVSGTPAPALKKSEKAPSKEKKEELPEVHIRTGQFKEFGNTCREALKNNATALNYLYERGLSDDDIEKYGIGYLRDSRGVPRVYIPYDKEDSYYVARRIDGSNENPKYLKPSTEKAGAEIQYHYKALSKNPKYVCIVEGTFDVMAIEISSHIPALAINTTGEPRPLRSLILSEQAKGNTPVYIICEDNDEPGTKGREKLENFLQEHNLEYVIANISDEYKDANELFIKDRERLKENVLSVVKGHQEEKLEALRIEKEQYQNKSTANHLQAFINGIADSVNTPPIATGYTELDNILDGGLYEGLYFVGAISSLGKTTFILQMLDSIASRGHDVILFSLEMSRTEIMSKSISRHTLLEEIARQGDLKNAKTNRGITDGTRWESYSNYEKELINTAITNYSKYASHIFIIEGIGDIAVQQIGDVVKKHIRLTGNTPVVFVDYLQILAPYDRRYTDKQNIDKAVLELKRLSRDYKLPVVGVSSFNRDNYNGSVTMASFKESGAIEYGSDVLIGLQPKGIGTSNFSLDDWKNESPRSVELKILKNRNGRTNMVLDYDYYTLFNYYKEE